jgi:hypothetical protein
VVTELESAALHDMGFAGDDVGGAAAKLGHLVVSDGQDSFDQRAASHKAAENRKGPARGMTPGRAPAASTVKPVAAPASPAEKKAALAPRSQGRETR